ncbi:hypothetical protein B296_00057880 [Ensete ventricosum]|uniref:F-box domain-containing protein n=1 Tax=Ensete ventricosum TaxID=4639 RepID=A0A426XIK9_ENSVE|nr:hypothetical protein B296_00057880 [Ensete ventricosum]
MSPRNRFVHRVENVEESEEMSVLDLPELTLECILGKLSPTGLSNMAAVCSSLRERCRSDHLWEKHMKEKWGRLIGHAARREWKQYLSSANDSSSAAITSSNRSKKWIGVLACVWPISLLKSRIDGGHKPKSPSPDDSVMSWYQSLESGKFWFPAQIYNREHGHVGFMLSCYDAEISYDSHSDTFHARFLRNEIMQSRLCARLDCVLVYCPDLICRDAYICMLSLLSIVLTCRYPPHGRRAIVIEEGVQWDRLRAPPVGTPAHELHISDCLSDLRPGDHIEIQWRRNKEFPYGGCFNHRFPYSDC